MGTELLRESVRQFVDQQVAPLDGAADRAGHLPDGLWGRLAALELTGLVVPADHGGSGADLAAAVVVAEELAAGSAALAWAWLEHTDATWILAELGTAAAKSRFLPGLVAGDLVGSSLKATEAGGGSSPAAITTTARASAGGYVLHGRKVFQSLAGMADLYLVVARMDPAPTTGPFGVLAVGPGDPGVSFGARERTMGLRALPIGEIVLEHCLVPADRLVGPPGGFGAVLARHGRLAPLLVAAIATGLAAASVRETLGFLADREVGGRRLAELPAVQLRVADLLADLESSRGLVERAVRGGGADFLGTLAKVAASEAAARVIDGCQKLCGSAGYSTDFPIERRARDVRALALHYGTNDQLRQVVGRAALAAAGPSR